MDVGQVLIEALQAFVVCVGVLALLRVMSGPAVVPEEKEAEEEEEDGQEPSEDCDPRTDAKAS